MACNATNCFWDVGAPTDPDDNACVLPADVRSDDSGWSWRFGTSEICLVGDDCKKTIGDEFEIFLITGTP
ncbi:MAG: hypothetical protein V3T05_01395 [Myxococcota bacterium]